MDNNNYQPIYEQPQQTQQPQFEQPLYQQTAQPNLQQSIDEAFSKALAATIMSGIGFPIVSIIGMIFGSKALKTITELYNQCSLQGIALPGKLRTAKILATIGKWYGLANTIIWAFVIAIYILYFVFIFGMLFISEL